MSAHDSQVGGAHYRSMKIQPVEFIHANGIPYLEGNVIKYVVRHKAKNGKQDLEKAKHYIQMIIEREYPDAATGGDSEFRTLSETDSVTYGDEYQSGDFKWRRVPNHWVGQCVGGEHLCPIRRPIGKATK